MTDANEITMGQAQPFIPSNMYDHVNNWRRTKSDDGWCVHRDRATDSCPMLHGSMIGDRPASHIFDPRRNYGCVPPFAPCMDNIIDYEGYLRANLGVVGLADGSGDARPSSAYPTALSADSGNYGTELFQSMREADVLDMRDGHEFLSMRRGAQMRKDEERRRKELAVAGV